MRRYPAFAFGMKAVKIKKKDIKFHFENLFGVSELPLLKFYSKKNKKNKIFMINGIMKTIKTG